MQHPLTGPRVIDILKGCGKQTRLDSVFVADVTVFDGTMMAPSTPFTKVWRLRNTGGFNWPRGSQLVWMGGERFSDSVSVEVEVGECFNFNPSLFAFRFRFSVVAVFLHFFFCF